MAHTRDGMTRLYTGNLVGLDVKVCYLRRVKDLA